MPNQAFQRTARKRAPAELRRWASLSSIALRHQPMRAALPLLLALLSVAPASYAADGELLCKACELVFDRPFGAYPAAVRTCAIQPEQKRTGCVATFVATFYRKREQVAEFVVLHDNLVSRCPSEQTREYFKERLYYLATQLDREDIPPLFKDFDFGPVALSVLGPLGAHTDPDNKGRMYARALERHMPSKPPYFQQMLDRCKAAQPDAAADRPQAGSR